MSQYEDWPIKYVFVYGTLRPDDDSNAPWTSKWNSRIAKSHKAFVKGALLYLDEYPTAILDKQYEGGTEDCKDAIIHGYVQTVESKQEFDDLIKLGDEIEEYPNFYQRTIVEAFVHDFGDFVKCFVYFRRENVKKDKPITSGDWLLRRNEPK